MAVSVERESGHHTVSATASQKKMTVFLTHLAGMPVNRKYIAFCAIFTTKLEESKKQQYWGLQLFTLLNLGVHFLMYFVFVKEKIKKYLQVHLPDTLLEWREQRHPNLCIGSGVESA